MPLTPKGNKIKAALTEEYGPEKGKRVLYAGKKKGTFTGIDAKPGDLVAQAVKKAQKAGKAEAAAQKQARALLKGESVSGRDRARALKR